VTRNRTLESDDTETVLINLATIKLWSDLFPFRTRPSNTVLPMAVGVCIASQKIRAACANPSMKAETLINYSFFAQI
jgi:hypothetical protein